jgi:hypothetical protein
MRLIKITAAGLAAALLATTGVALASAQFKQTAKVALTATKPNASSGIRAVISSSDPGAPFGKPLALKTLKLTFPANTRFNFKSKALAQCKASEAEIKATKGAACPAKSRVGTGGAAIDGAPVFASAPESVTAFAGKNEVLLLLVPTGPAGSTLVLHARVSSNRLSAEVPLLAVGPVTFVLTELKLTVKATGKGSSAFIRAGKCAKKKFVVTSSFAYYTGEKLTLSSSSKCR